MNIIIRSPLLKDSQQFLAAVSQSEFIHHSFTKAPATSEEFIDYIAQFNQPNHKSWLICSEIGDIIGVINLSQIIRGCFQSGYLGFYVMHPFAGKGLMSAGLKQVLAKIFNEMALHRVEANIQPNNVASIKLVSRNGFRLEGYSPNYLKILNEWKAHERWALTVEDYQKKSLSQKSSKLKIIYEKNPSSADIRILSDGIDENTRIKKALDPIDYFSFFLRDETNQVKGGCNGVIYYGCLYVDQLWVTESLRGNGYGTQLMQKAENLAIESKCNFIAVNTFDWEALNFYKKLGFYVEFERTGFDKNSIFYFLRKDLI